MHACVRVVGMEVAGIQVSANKLLGYAKLLKVDYHVGPVRVIIILRVHRLKFRGSRK